MGGRFDFTTYLANERREIAESLTEDERAVFHARANGASVVQASLALDMSESTVCRRSRDVMRKINRMHGMNRRTK